METAEIIRIYAQSHDLAEPNAGLMCRHTDALVTKLCAARMQVVGAADALLESCRGRADLPQELVDFFAAEDDQGCPSCWLSSRYPKEHPECAQKIDRYFATRERLMVFGRAL